MGEFTQPGQDRPFSPPALLWSPQPSERRRRPSQPTPGPSAVDRCHRQPAGHQPQRHWRDSLRTYWRGDGIVGLGPGQLDHHQQHRHLWRHHRRVRMTMPAPWVSWSTPAPAATSATSPPCHARARRRDRHVPAIERPHCQLGGGDRCQQNLVSVTNTGSGNNVLATSPTLVTPILGTPTSGHPDQCHRIAAEHGRHRQFARDQSQ